MPRRWIVISTVVLLGTACNSNAKRAELVEVASGKTCQYEVADKTIAHRGAIGTVIYRTREDCWVVTCNLDDRDSGARKACGVVLAGWKSN